MNRRILRIEDGASLDDIIKKYKLDKRRKYFLYGGYVVTNTWITMECSGCTEYSEGYKISGPAGCEECGYRGKRRNCYPAAVMLCNETNKVMYTN